MTAIMVEPMLRRKINIMNTAKMSPMTALLTIVSTDFLIGFP